MMLGATYPKNLLDRQSGIPLYQQLYELLRGKITAGEWTPGDVLPTETSLVEQYQLSRATVRQAFDALVNDGLIYRERGRGTFVAQPAVEQALVRIISFTEDMRQRGLQPVTRVLSAGLAPATSDLAQRLAIEPGGDLARIERLRLADGQPMSVEVSYLVHAYCPGVLAYDFEQQPLRDILETAYDLRLTSARQAIRAINAPEETAVVLDVMPDAALLFIERVSYSQHNLPVEFLRIYHRGDRYALYNELKG